MKIFKCESCGKIIGIIQDSQCPTKCCGENMVELIPNTSDGATEKHVPVVTVEGNLVRVNVGSADHPMLEQHYIQWILLETTQGRQKKDLKPGDKPYAEFALCEGEKPVCAYEYCNLHGLWKADI